MHEGGFTEQIVQEILKALKERPGVIPKAVRVKVGEVFHLHPDAVLMHYRLFTQGTVLEGVSLELEEVPLEVACRNCRKTGGVLDHHLLFCRYCDSRDVEVLQGNQITTEWIEGL